jgi:hypothetical protein
MHVTTFPCLTQSKLIIAENPQHYAQLMPHSIMHARASSHNNQASAFELQLPAWQSS